MFELSSRRSQAILTILAVALLAAGVVGCGSGNRTENTGEPGIPAPTAKEEAEVDLENAVGGEAGRKQEAAELLQETKDRANQVVEEADQRAAAEIKEAKADPSLSKSELKAAKEEAKEVLEEAKESAKKALEGAKAKAEEVGG
jgi:hypothetical protein